MANEEIEEKGKKSKVKVIIILLLVVIIALGAFIGYFVVTGKNLSDVIQITKKTEEYTTLLDEFVVNLNSEDGVTKNYLKIQVALMYTNEKKGKVIDFNVNKIRDIIVDDLRIKKAEEISDKESFNNIKKELIASINQALNEDIVKDIYFTNMIIQ